jgi:hypothetical protein
MSTRNRATWLRSAVAALVAAVLTSFTTATTTTGGKPPSGDPAVCVVIRSTP